MGGGHDQGRRDALAGDVAADQADQAVRKLDEVVEVSAHRLGRLVVGGHIPAGELGQFPGQELSLDELGDLQLLLDALSGLELGRLLADELAHQLGHP